MNLKRIRAVINRWIQPGRNGCVRHEWQRWQERNGHRVPTRIQVYWNPGEGVPGPVIFEQSVNRLGRNHD